jgi:hypothetical protein
MLTSFPIRPLFPEACGLTVYSAAPGCQSVAAAVRGPLQRKLGIHDSVLATADVAFRLKTINS